MIGIDLIKMTPSVCEVDGTTFSYSSSYSHQKNAPSSKEYSCSVRQKGFKSSKTLQVHKKSHDETSHHCDQCDQDFTNIGNLSRHVNSAHKKLGFSCAMTMHKRFHHIWNTLIYVYVFIVRNIHLNMVTSFAQKLGRNNAPVCCKNCHFTNF